MYSMSHDDDVDLKAIQAADDLLLLFNNVSSLQSLCFPGQKHGLKVYMRDPHSFTPILEEGVGGRPPRSLLLGVDLAKNQQEIGKFSEKDAKVLCECREDFNVCVNTCYAVTSTHSNLIMSCRYRSILIF